MAEIKLLTTLFTGCSTTLFTSVDNLQRVVRFYVCTTKKYLSDARAETKDKLFKQREEELTL